MIVGVVCRVAFIISRSLAFVFLHSSGRGGGAYLGNEPWRPLGILHLGMFDVETLD